MGGRHCKVEKDGQKEERRVYEYEYEYESSYNARGVEGW